LRSPGNTYKGDEKNSEVHAQDYRPEFERPGLVVSLSISVFIRRLVGGLGVLCTWGHVGKYIYSEVAGLLMEEPLLERASAFIFIGRFISGKSVSRVVESFWLCWWDLLGGGLF
jgi:hypothetical protein